MEEYQCDVAVIGAGTAGLSAARHATKDGARVLLIDDKFAGTTCATTGCMPSKVLIAAGKVAHAIDDAPAFGITAKANVDGAAVMARVREMRDHYALGVKRQIDEMPSDTKARGRAHFLSPTSLSLGDDRIVRMNACVIATGAAAFVPPPFEEVSEIVHTHETIFELEDLPRHLGVIGAGPIGMELAQAFARLGVTVTVLARGQEVLGIPNDEIGKVLRNAMSEEMALHTGVDVKATKTPQGARLTWDGETSGEIEVDCILMAAGRPPLLDGLRLDAAGLEVDEHGIPIHDHETMQCGDAPIFIAGDVTGYRPVLHEAAHEGTIAGRNAASFPAIQPFRRKVPMTIAFTSPNVAMIGEKPDNPDARGSVTGVVSFADQGRAKAERTNVGRCHIYADDTDGKLRGATLCGPDIEHIAHQLGWAVQQGCTASGMLELPFYHPVYEEGLKSALVDICRKVGAPKPDDRNDAELPGDQ